MNDDSSESMEVQGELPPYKKDMYVVLEALSRPWYTFKYYYEDGARGVFGNNGRDVDFPDITTHWNMLCMDMMSKRHNFLNLASKQNAFRPKHEVYVLSEFWHRYVREYSSLYNKSGMENVPQNSGNLWSSADVIAKTEWNVAGNLSIKNGDIKQKSPESVTEMPPYDRNYYLALVALNEKEGNYVYDYWSDGIAWILDEGRRPVEVVWLDFSRWSNSTRIFYGWLEKRKLLEPVNKGEVVGKYSRSKISALWKNYLEAYLDEFKGQNLWETEQPVDQWPDKVWPVEKKKSRFRSIIDRFTKVKNNFL